MTANTARWTRGDKRGTPAGRNVEEKDQFRESSITRVLPRPDFEIRQAAAWFAWDALAHAGSGAYAAVEEVLAVLGLDRPALDQQREREEPCWPYGGSMRGVNIHRKSYTYPCGPCKIIRDNERQAPARRLGITHEGMVS